MVTMPSSTSRRLTRMMFWFGPWVVRKEMATPVASCAIWPQAGPYSA